MKLFLKGYISSIFLKKTRKCRMVDEAIKKAAVPKTPEPMANILVAFLSTPLNSKILFGPGIPPKKGGNVPKTIR